jgi:polyisoprenoid-binding protein YceI
MTDDSSTRSGTTQQAAARPGVKSEFPASATWAIDPGHSIVQFEATHLMVSNVRGRFRAIGGAIRFGERPEDSSVELVVEAASLDTCESRRDAHLQSADFLDVQNHPTLSFRSSSFDPGDGRHCRLSGELTIRGITRPVGFDVTYQGLVDDPWGSQRLGFSARTEIDRRDFAVSWNERMPGGGLIVGDTVRIEIEIEAASPGAQL